MRFDVHIHHHHEGLARIEAGINELAALMLRLLAKGEQMTAEVQNIINEVREARDVMSAGTTLIRGLAAQIRDHIDDREALLQVANDLDAATNEMSSAITENTPAAPPSE